MGQYPITAGVFGKALAIPGTGNGGTITTPSAWLFEMSLRWKYHWNGNIPKMEMSLKWKCY